MSFGFPFERRSLLSLLPRPFFAFFLQPFAIGVDVGCNRCSESASFRLQLATSLAHRLLLFLAVLSRAGCDLFPFGIDHAARVLQRGTFDLQLAVHAVP